MKRSVKRKEVIDICVKILDQILLETNNHQKLLLSMDAIKMELTRRLMFKVPVYDDYLFLFSEVSKDLRTFMVKLENVRFSYSMQDFKMLENEIIASLSRFFKNIAINSFLREFSLLTTLLAASFPGLIISIINLLIK